MRTLTVAVLLTTVWIVNSSVIRTRKKRSWTVESLPLDFILKEEDGQDLPYTLGTVTIDKDILHTCILSGPGADQEPVGVFQINRKEAVIEVHKKVDYEKNKNFKLNVDCHGSEEVHIFQRVDIQVLDINNNPPVFNEASYETSVEESTLQGTDLVTVSAVDPDDSRTGNGLFTFRIVSVSPSTPNLEFFIKQQQQTGQISFRGCLDYEEAQTYRIVVEVKDFEEVKQLISTATVTINIIDGNNHKPELPIIHGSGRVKEGESGVVVYRLEVNDKDSPGTAAWRTKYTIRGEKDKNFKAESDPRTNQGIISVQTPLDFEESPQLSLLVGVENQEPYFSCKVKQKRIGGLWEVDYFRETSGSALLTVPINITVEDINEPPALTNPIKYVTVMENTVAGHSLWTFSAVDQDRSSAKVRFFKGEDEDDWVTVDSETGQVSTDTVLDRESPFVKDSNYRVTVLAVDDDEPPATATGTLFIHLLDQNDNLPKLQQNSLSMCVSEEPIRGSLSATDLDLYPFGGPFIYELVGNSEGTWTIEPSFGWNVSLVKDGSVCSGRYDLRVKVSDLQGNFSVQDLRVSVVDCVLSSRTSAGNGPTVRLSATAIAVIVTALVTTLLLLTFSLSCKKARRTLILDLDLQGSSSRLVSSNTECRGSDCGSVTQINSGSTEEQRRSTLNSEEKFY